MSSKRPRVDWAEGDNLQWLDANDIGGFPLASSKPPGTLELLQKCIDDVWKSLSKEERDAINNCMRLQNGKVLAYYLKPSMLPSTASEYLVRLCCPGQCDNLYPCPKDPQPRSVILLNAREVEVSRAPKEQFCYVTAHEFGHVVHFSSLCQMLSRAGRLNSVSRLYTAEDEEVAEDFAENHGWVEPHLKPEDDLQAEMKILMSHLNRFGIKDDYARQMGRYRS